MLCVTPVTDRKEQPQPRLRRLLGMRMRLLALTALSVVVAGCGTSALAGAGGQHPASAASSATPVATTSAAASSAKAGTLASGAPARTAERGLSCQGAQAPSYQPGVDGLQFVSATQGWAVSQATILATTDGGAHWRAQLSGKLNLTSVDFVSRLDGWAVGTTSLLATTDGGAHWTALPEPCQVIRSVHFISPATGFAVAGGQNVGGADPEVPDLGGVVLTTSDGGHTWHPLAAPANAQTVCFSDPTHGWLGADGLLYRSSDGGKKWTVLTSMAGDLGSGYPADMTVECANDGSAWALRVGPGAAMSQDPHVGYHANQSGVTAIFAEQYFQPPGQKPTAQSPGSNAGPFSAINATGAAFIDWCSACGYGTAPWDVASNSGATLTKEGNVGAITYPQAASFLSAKVGWVAGSETVYPSSATGTTKSQERIVATTNGGRTWHVQWAGAWSAQ
jgi:Photosynthesis system II assembly factor YCF48